MTTIVLHLHTLAVTEYSTEFTGLAGDIECASGVCEVGGTLDIAAVITPSLSMGLNLGEGAKQQRPRQALVHGTGLGSLTARVTNNAGTTYEYDGAEVHGRATRFKLGKGLRDAYLMFGLAGNGDSAVEIDRIDFDTMSAAQRRL